MRAEEQSNMRREHRTRVEEHHRRRFERLVRTAIRRLPRGFERFLDNVAILIEDEPTPEQRSAGGIGPEETLFGLYEGTPLPARGLVELPMLPDRITIFRRPIERSCQSEAEIVEEIRRTIVHEVAHHLGFEEDQLPF